MAYEEKEDSREVRKSVWKLETMQQNMAKCNNARR